MTFAQPDEPPARLLRVRVLVASPDSALLVGRTVRSLRAAGLSSSAIAPCATDELPTLLAERGPLWLILAGAWLVDPWGWAPPPPSATGKGLCAFGLPRGIEAPAETVHGGSVTGVATPGSDWARLWSATGGDLNRFTGSDALVIPEPPSMFLDGRAVTVLAEARTRTLAEVLRAALGQLRVVHYGPLDVRLDARPRAMQLITSLQRGGAERVTLDLAAELPGLGVSSHLATLGRPGRAPFPTPRGTLDLTAKAGPLESRLAWLTRYCTAAGIDLIHGHLISGEVAKWLSATGLSVVLTAHNTRQAWPPGLVELRSDDVGLLAACAGTVAADLRAAGIKVPVRTARNGIDCRQYQPTPERLAGRAIWRQRWGFKEADFILISVANPRPQKRLDRLPAILAGLRARLASDREARLVFCGEPMQGNSQAAESVARAQAEVERLGLGSHVVWAGAVSEVPELLAAADLLLSASAHEGLSLAWLEALAMGRPVVATEVGGAREVARDHTALRLVATEATPEEFVEAILPFTKATIATPGEARFQRNWSSRQMAVRYADLYRRVLASAGRTRPGRGLWLVTNNFSTGGAQSSARRLLLGLAAQGVPVRAAVVEEHPGYPTPGRQALQRAGVPVLVAGPADDFRGALEGLLRAIDADAPRSVVFWNLRPSWKVAVADSLLGTPVFDVSPGEMYFDSLDRHFAKADGAWPCQSAGEYGALLSGVVVKYRAEATRATATLGAPVHVIPNGVPLPPPTEARASGGAIVFGSAARINPQKRLEDLISAFHSVRRENPHCSLRIAGGVEHGCEAYAAELRERADGLPIEWLGEISDLPAFHRSVEVFAMVSEPAGCPNASLEAMAAGLPVVATDVGGASEQVLEGRTGRLVPARAPEAMAAAMLELAASERTRARMGAAGREHIAAAFSLDRMLADYRRLLLPDT